jgi:hypothetical protein
MMAALEGIVTAVVLFALFGLVGCWGRRRSGPGTGCAGGEGSRGCERCAGRASEGVP